MKKFLLRSFCFQLVFMITASFSGVAHSDTLNPERVNPHENAPRKKISQAQKDAAWEAKKKKMAEIEARKALNGQTLQTTGDASTEKPGEKQENGNR